MPKKRIAVCLQVFGTLISTLQQTTDRLRNGRHLAKDREQLAQCAAALQACVAPAGGAATTSKPYLTETLTEEAAKAARYAAVAYRLSVKEVIQRYAAA